MYAAIGLIITSLILLIIKIPGWIKESTEFDDYKQKQSIEKIEKTKKWGFAFNELLIPDWTGALLDRDKHKDILEKDGNKGMDNLISLYELCHLEGHSYLIFLQLLNDKIIAYITDTDIDKLFEIPLSTITSIELRKRKGYRFFVFNLSTEIRLEAVTIMGFCLTFDDFDKEYYEEKLSQFCDNKQILKKNF